MLFKIECAVSISRSPLRVNVQVHFLPILAMLYPKGRKAAFHMHQVRLLSHPENVI
jgi:hypothetical protein